MQSVTLADLRKLTRTTVVAETASPVRGLAELTGVRHLERDGAQVTFDVESDHLDEASRAIGRRALRVDRRVGTEPVAQPPADRGAYARS